MNNAILMSSGADNIDFMIHGIFSYEIFGHTVWITTSHVCILIVMLLMLGLAIAANRTMKHAKEIPEGFQNVLEIMVEKLDAMVYGTMGKEMVEEMKKLIGKADIITPNFTEVTFLLDKEYKKEISEAEIKEWLIELAAMGPKIVIATSVPDEDSHSTDRKTNVVAYDRENDVFWKVSCKYIPASYPGTGDAYTSVVIGSLLQGDSLPIAIERGVQFITQCILASYGFKYPNREGVLLERMLDVLKMPTISSSYELLKNEK